MEIQRKLQDVKKQKGDITKNNHLNDNDIFKMIELQMRNKFQTRVV